jgi:hypothetical protein
MQEIILKMLYKLIVINILGIIICLLWIVVNFNVSIIVITIITIMI